MVRKTTRQEQFETHAIKLLYAFLSAHTCTCASVIASRHDPPFVAFCLEMHVCIANMACVVLSTMCGSMYGVLMQVGLVGSYLHEFTELNFLSVGSQLPPRTLNILID